MANRKFLPLYLLFIIIFISGCSIKDCGYDLMCFKESAKTCSRVKVNLIEEGSNIRVTVRGLTIDSCKVSFKIDGVGQKIKEQHPFETKIAIGKTLNCKINKKYADYENIDYTKEIFNLPEEFDKSCTGPIKDLMTGPLGGMVKEEFDKMLEKNS